MIQCAQLFVPRLNRRRARNARLQQSREAASVGNPNKNKCTHTGSSCSHIAEKPPIGSSRLEHLPRRNSRAFGIGGASPAEQLIRKQTPPRACRQSTRRNQV